MARTIAYLMSRFPKISETFILYEILELQGLGLKIEIFPLLHEHEAVQHREAARLVREAHYTQYFSPAIVIAQFYWLLRRPGVYLSSWWRALFHNRYSLKFLLRALVVIPVAAYFARRALHLGVQHIHAHWATHPALAAWVMNQLTDIPYSFTAHAHDIYVARPMLREKIRGASFIVTISEYNKQFLERLYGNEVSHKIHVIHCGVDPGVFAPRFNENRGARFTLLCIASLNDYKGHEYLVTACALLKRENISFCCLLVGEGEMRKEIEQQIAKLGLEKHIFLLGWQPRDAVSELMTKADVLVLPSIKTISGKKEGIPVALMEGMAMQLPVVASSISGIPELVQHGRTGLLVPEKEPQALADALFLLYRSPELRTRLGQAGRAKVLQDFNLHRNAEKLFKLFDREEPGVNMDPLLTEVPEWQNQGATKW